MIKGIIITMTNLESSIDRARLAIIGAIRVIKKPQYLILAVLISLAFCIAIYIPTKGGFYSSLFMSQLPIFDKIIVFDDMINKLSKEIFTNINGLLLGAVSILQGISMSMIIYTIRKNRDNHKSIETTQIGLSGFAAIAAAIGLGCVPCGTSIILPIVMIFFSGSAVAAAADFASGVVLSFALIASFYSIYKVGYSAYVHSECENCSIKQGDQSNETK